MARQPLQVIVIPFRKSEHVGYQFAVFHRADDSRWQFIAGGAEDDETAAQAARREAAEEAGIPKGARFFRLDSRASVPKTAFSPTDHWPKDLFVVPEYSFAVDVSGQELDLSHEHDKVRWLSFEEATRLLTWESNRIALWELNERLNTEMTSSKPHRIMVAVDDLKLADVCRQHGYGIEIQSFLEPEKVPDLQRVLGDIQPRSLHGPFGDLCAGSYDSMIREVTRHRFELAYRFARELECPDIILHHGYVPGTSAPQNWLSRCVSFWHDFLDSKEASVRYHVENMLEWDAVLLTEVIDAINDPRVDVCLDIGHCHCNSRETPIAWIERLGPRIGWVHLHNNNGESDEHLSLEQGTIPIGEVCSALLEYAPEAVWCLEALDEGISTSIEWIQTNGFG